MIKIYFDNILLDPTKYRGLNYKHKLFNDNDNFILGSVSSKQFFLTLPKKLYFNASLVTLYEDEELIATLDIDSISDNDDSTYTINLVDKMVMLEDKYDASNLIKNNNITTVKDVLEDICRKHNIELGTTSFLNDNEIVNSWDNRINARVYVSRIAELNAGFAFIGADGKLYLKKYSNISKGIINLDDTSSFKIKEKHIITRVVYDVGGPKYEFGDNSGETVYLDKANHFINNEQVVKNVYDALVGLEFYSIKVDRCNQLKVEIGDMITFQKDDQSYPTFVQIDNSYNGGWLGGYSFQVKNSKQKETNIKSDAEKVKDLSIDLDYVNQLYSITNKKIEKTKGELDLLNPIKSVSGNPVFLQNSAGKDIPRLVIKGNSFQEIDPNPDKPSEIKTIKGIEQDGWFLQVRTLSTIKNLFNAKETEFENRTNTDLFIENSNQIRLVNAGVWNRRVANFKLEPNTTYTISSDVINESGARCGLYENDSNFDITSNQNFKSIIQVTSTSDGSLNITFYSNWSGTALTNTVIFDNIQIEKGTEATEYEAFDEETALVDLNQYDEEGHIVNHYELAKIGDVYDELEVTSGNLIKKIGKIESYTNEEITTNYMSSTGILSSGATVYYVLKEEQHINLRYTKVSTFEDDCYIGIDDELIDFFDCDYYTKSKITEYFETQKDSEAKMQILSDSITQKVSEVNTTVKNNELAFNEKLNDFAKNESVEQQISSVENKITSSEQKITIINELLENGISQIRTEKGYTFNDQGLTIDDSNSKVQNKLAENGMTIIDKSSNTTLLFAGYDETSQETIVKAENMTVEKYFVAPNCRFEEYNNPNHGKGTGVFSL